jgi:uncharacterized protein (UPF0332 family)
VSGAWADPVARAREELAASRELLAGGFPSQAVARAYQAGFQAAVAAVRAAGEVPTTEAGVIVAFGRSVVGESGVDREAGRTLRKLFEDRNDVDHGLLDAPVEEAEKALAGAEVLVEAAARWVDARQGATKA